MKKLNVKTNPFGNKNFEFVDAPERVIIEWRDFEVLLKKKENKIIALENNFLSRKYFGKLFKDSKYMIFNLAFGLKNASYTNNLNNEDLVEEVIVLWDERLNYRDFTVDIYQELTSEQLDEIIEFCEPLFSDLLKEARENLKLTQSEVAARIGVELQSYQRYEYGSRLPDGKTMIKLVRLLNLNILEVEKSL